MRARTLLVTLALTVLGAPPDARAAPGLLVTGTLWLGDAPAEGPLELRLSFFAEVEGGVALWEDVHPEVALEEGAFLVVLGDEVPPDALWLEVSVDDATLSPRLGVGDVLEALLADEALDLTGRSISARSVSGDGVGPVIDATGAWVGGVVDAPELRIGGDVVIDAQGVWRGVLMEVGFDQVAGVPDGIADGDDDVDTQLSPEQVRAIVAGAPLDLAEGLAVGALPVSTGPHRTRLPWGAVTEIPDDLLDGDQDTDTRLTGEQVDELVVSAPAHFAAGTTLAGVAISTGPHTERVSWDALTEIPDDLLDGDQDTDTRLTGEQVDAFAAAAPVDLAEGTRIGGQAVATGAHTERLRWDAIDDLPEDIADGDQDTDTLLTEEEVEETIADGPIDLPLGTRVGGLELAAGPHIDTLPWDNVDDLPEDLADGDDDTTLTVEQVVGFVTDDAIDFAAGTTVGGAAISTFAGGSVYRVVNSVDRSNALASCLDANDVILGGGCECHGSKCNPCCGNRFYSSRPHDDGWYCEWKVSTPVRAYVICLTVP